MFDIQPHAALCRKRRVQTRKPRTQLVSAQNAAHFPPVLRGMRTHLCNGYNLVGPGLLMHCALPPAPCRPEGPCADLAAVDAINSGKASDLAATQQASPPAMIAAHLLQ